MKNMLLSVLFLPLFTGAAVSAVVVPNGDFESLTSVENLWDGVDNSGRLKTPVGSRGTLRYGKDSVSLTYGSAPSAEDINGDGLFDIVCGDAQNDGAMSAIRHGEVYRGMLRFYLNSGTKQKPKFTSAEFVKYHLDFACKPFVIDWNGDRKKDILLGGFRGNVFLIENAGTPDRPVFTRTAGNLRISRLKYGPADLDIGTYSAPSAHDWNNDGKRDLLLGEGTYSANSIHVYVNGGSDSFPKFDENSRQYLAYGDGREYLTPALFDYDGNGVMDLLVGERDGYINIYLNKSAPRDRDIKTLEHRGRLKAGGSESFGSMCFPSAVDADGDSDQDLVVGDSSGLVYLCINEGTSREPKFSARMPVTGEDVLKDVNKPSGWSLGFNDGFFMMSSSEEANSGKSCLKVETVHNYGGEAYVLCDSSISLKVDSKYELSFDVCGQNMSGSWSFWYGGVPIVVGKERTHRNAGWSGNFAVSRQWRRIKAKFTVPRVADVPEAEQAGKERGCQFFFMFKGDGHAMLDNIQISED